jgi:hypothetical protein
VGKLDHYDPTDQARIKSLMRQLVEGQIERGEIPCTDEAIKAAMPEAFKLARDTINAVNEYLCG